MSYQEFLVLLAISIIIHEAGHYTFSRAFNVRVKRASLFFNLFFTFLKYDPLTKRLDIFSRKMPIELGSEEGGDRVGTEASRCLLSIQIAKTNSPAAAARKSGRLEYAKKIEINSIIVGDPEKQTTQYCLGWLPFGGYVALEYGGPLGVFSKGRFKQLLINLGGILFNFITMLLLMSIVRLYVACAGADGSPHIYFNFIKAFCWVLFSLVALNILPLPGLDGYHSLKCILNKYGALGGNVFNIVEDILSLLVFALIISSWFGVLVNIWVSFYDFVYNIFDVIYRFIAMSH